MKFIEKCEIFSDIEAKSLRSSVAVAAAPVVAVSLYWCSVCFVLGLSSILIRILSRGERYVSGKISSYGYELNCACIEGLVEVNIEIRFFLQVHVLAALPLDQRWNSQLERT